jgi:hypothetical protein
MLCRDPLKRATASDILRHHWLKENGCARDTPIEPEVLVRLEKFHKMNVFKREALRVSE